MDDNLNNIKKDEGGTAKHGYGYRMSGTPVSSFDRQIEHPAAPPDFDYFVDVKNKIRRDRRKTDGRFNRFVAAVLILCTIGAPFFGLGLGLGVRLFDRYLMPMLLSDSHQRVNFAFENVHTPLTTFPADRPSLPDLVQMVEPSTVLITAKGSNRGPMGFNFDIIPNAGSGIIIYETASRFYIATNAHVIEGAREVHVSIAGSLKIPAVPVGRDDDADLAVIAVYKFEAIERGATAVRTAVFGDSSLMRVGESVIAIGNSMGEGNTVTMGIVSAVDREIRVRGRNLLVMQTDAAINRGNSGGPLVNFNGEVIGINTAKFTEELAEGMGYAIPSNVAMPILERIMHYEGRPMIGVTIATLNPRTAEQLANALISQGFDSESFDMPGHGVLINSVNPNGPAGQADLRAGDIVTAVDGTIVMTSDEFIEILTSLSVGDSIALTLLRNASQVMEIEVTLGPHIPSF